MSINILKGLSDEGRNDKTQEYWTTIARKRVYAKSLESLCRTVAYGWTVDKAHDSENDVKFICIYCGQPGFTLSEPCSCFLTKGDRQKRQNALNKLNEIIATQSPLG